MICFGAALALAVVCVNDYKIALITDTHYGTIQDTELLDKAVEELKNDAQGVDLEVSGHTHAGQIWPVGWLSELTGVLNYGEYQSRECKVIVSSGFTGWGYPLRTEGHCEYVIIHLSQSS